MAPVKSIIVGTCAILCVIAAILSVVFNYKIEECKDLMTKTNENEGESTA